VKKTIQTAASAVTGDILPASYCLFARDEVDSIRFDSIGFDSTWFNSTWFNLTRPGSACSEQVSRNVGLA
jgi:hypothetical protein